MAQGALTVPVPAKGLLRAVTPAALTAGLDASERQRQEAARPQPKPYETDLAGYIRDQYSMMRRHRDGSNGWSGRMMHALRTFNGEYEPDKLAQIRKMSGSEVYARVTATKCRGASALLRDVYLSADRPWGIDPPADPDIEDEAIAAIQQLVMAEVQSAQAGGQPPDPARIKERFEALMDVAREAARRDASKRTKLAGDKIEELFQEGGFYTALAELLVDVPIFPFGCLKGPEVRIVPTVKWVKGKAQVVNTPKFHWRRVSPFDLFWTPGVTSIEDANIIERERFTRADLNDLLDLPGYDHLAVREVLTEYGTRGLTDDWDGAESERAAQENRENPRLNQSGLITCLEFTGNVQGSMLLDYGMEAEKIPDPVRDYQIQAWLIGRHVIKAQLAPSPRRRHGYYVTSFDKVPGTPVGNGLPDILTDIQDVCNATVRALVNNVSIASGPQVAVMVDRAAPGADISSLYPWKRWYVTADPMGSSGGGQKPVEFFQPDSRAQELIATFSHFSQLADEISAIPRSLSGINPAGGAGRTASGLAMLMGNASKVLQTVAANIDRDILEPVLGQLYDMIMLTDQTGLLMGDEAIRVKGVSVAVQRETERSRQVEFLQLTANPFDMDIMGKEGRAALLRAVGDTVGLDGQSLVPSEVDMANRVQAEQAAAAQQAAQQQAMAQQGMAPPGQPQHPAQQQQQPS